MGTKQISKIDVLPTTVRRTPEPVILEIDARQAMEEGMKIEKASEKVFIVDYIPRKFI